MFHEIFKVKKPIIGMIHLAGDSPDEKVNRALEELAIYEEEDVHKVLNQSVRGFKIIRGVNLLSNPYSAFELASNFGAKFVQFDSVQRKHLMLREYERLRREFPNIAVLGGVRFKYTNSTGNSLEEDINDGKLRCDAIVTTGEGTGIETPIEKLRDFRAYLKDFQLIVGAGVNFKNVYEQLSVSDGAFQAKQRYSCKSRPRIS
jgi:predicted TIM-barrel enzyme